MEQVNEEELIDSLMRAAIEEELSQKPNRMKDFSLIESSAPFKLSLKAWDQNLKRWVRIKILHIHTSDLVEDPKNSNNKSGLISPFLENLKQFESTYLQKILNVIYLRTQNPQISNSSNDKYPKQSLSLVGIVSEFRANSNLRCYISKHPLNIDESIRISCKIIAGTQDLHEKFNSIHMSLKPENILIDEHGSIKIDDYFGELNYICTKYASPPDQLLEDMFSSNYKNPLAFASNDLTFTTDISSTAILGQYLCNETVDQEKHVERNRYFRNRAKPVLKLFQQLRELTISPSEILIKLDYFFAVARSEIFGLRIYEGLRNNKEKYHGKGKLTTKSLSVLYCTWENGIKQGHGVIYYKNGDIFDGQIVNGKCEGQGMTVYYKAGIGRYEGDFKNSQITGRGATFIGDTDLEMRGEFLNGFIGGIGFQRFSGGDIYEGNYVNGKRQGIGKYYWHASRITYYGNWHDNGQLGRGTYTYPDGSKFIGEAKNNIWQGKGTFKYASGTCHVGEYLNHKRHGFGVLTEVLQGVTTVYEGQFENNLKHGIGKKTFSNQEITVQGIWKADLLVSNLSEQEYQEKLQEIQEQEAQSRIQTVNQRNCTIF